MQSYGGVELAKYSDEEISQMRTWFLIEGLSATQIAKKRGRGESRNAMIGILHRNGIKRGEQAKAASPSRPRRPRFKPASVGLVAVAPIQKASKGDAHSRSFVQKNGEAKPASPILVLNRRGLATIAGADGFLPLAAGMCKNPVGLAEGADQQFCGAKVTRAQDAPYCEACARLNYVTPTGRQDRAFKRGVERALGEWPRPALKAFGAA